jgi:hypothetical protein
MRIQSPVLDTRREQTDDVHLAADETDTHRTHRVIRQAKEGGATQKEASDIRISRGADVTLDGHGASVSMGDVAGDNHQCCRSDVLTDTILLRRKLWDRSASTRKTRTG